MSSPKHLWSGDWQRDSESAAAQRADRRLALPEAAPPIEPPARVPDGPSRSARALARLRAVFGALRRGLRSALAAIYARRPRARVVAVIALTALAVVGAAYGLTRINRTDGSPSRVAAQPAWLGLQLTSYPSGAVVVAGVAPGGPAAAAGIRAGDVITEFDGRPVVTPVNVTEGVDVLNAGDKVDLQVQRGPHRFRAQATLAARRSPTP